MKKTIKIFTIFFLIAIICNIAIYSNKSRLNTKHKTWLDLVHYIITPLEKKTFNKLTNNHERNVFIELFWKLRDPTEGTPDNEHKTKLINRFKYVNKYFKFGVPGAGWKSERGRIYMLLGPPVSINEVIKNKLNPVLIWTYHGGLDKKLPTMFNIVFYKKSGFGKYKLYLPSVDGPAALLNSSIGQIDPNNFKQIYQEIRKIEPTVADISLSLVPGESSIGYNISLQSSLLIQRIYELPKKNINISYAKNFHNFKGIVKTTTLTNYIDMKTELHIIKDPILNINFVHFALRPRKVSVNYSKNKNQYYFNYNLIVIIKNNKDIVYTYKKQIPYYCSKEDMEDKLSHGVIIADYFPIIYGNYKLTILLQNTVNQEISYFEKKINIKNNSKPLIYGPIISYHSKQKQQAGYSAFSIYGQSIKIDPNQIYSMNDKIYTTFFIDRVKNKEVINIKLEVKSIDEKRKYQKEYVFNLKKNKKFYSVNQKLEKLSYGNYIVKLQILGKDNKSIHNTINKYLTISPKQFVSHPPIISKIISNDMAFVFYMMLADQYKSINNSSKTEYFFEKAISLNNSFPVLIKKYGTYLLKKKKFNRLFEILKNLKGQVGEEFGYYSLTGKALYFKNQYKKSILYLQKANKIFGSDITVLNTLGYALIKIGNIEEGKNVLSASLKINENQKYIRIILDKIHKK